jgi:hypothetical protein
MRQEHSGEIYGDELIKLQEEEKFSGEVDDIQVLVRGHTCPEGPHTKKRESTVRD